MQRSLKTHLGQHFFAFGGFLKTITTVQDGGVESKNGVQAIHLRGDQSTVFAAGQPTLPPGATVDVWVSTDGQYLVALEESGLASSTGPTSVKVEITNINDPSLTVKAPS